MVNDNKYNIIEDYSVKKIVFQLLLIKAPLKYTSRFSSSTWKVDVPGGEPRVRIVSYSHFPIRPLTPHDGECRSFKIARAWQRIQCVSYPKRMRQKIKRVQLRQNCYNRNRKSTLPQAECRHFKKVDYTSQNGQCGYYHLHRQIIT